MTMDEMNDVVKRIGMINVSKMDPVDQVKFIGAYYTFVEAVQPIIDKYVPNKGMIAALKKALRDERENR